jgi:hypothetical protein
METPMRAHGVLVALILAIAAYFTLFWGFDALRILTSPTYGLDDVWRSQTVFGIGRFAGFSPDGLIKLAAALGAIKLVVAGVFAVHIIDRVRAMMFGSADPGVLEGALLLVIVITMISAAPALWTSNADLLREFIVQLLLAGLAAALLIIERSRYAPELEDVSPTDDLEMLEQPTQLATVPERAWFAPWR